MCSLLAKSVLPLIGCGVDRQTQRKRSVQAKQLPLFAANGWGWQTQPTQRERDRHSLDMQWPAQHNGNGHWCSPPHWQVASDRLHTRTDSLCSCRCWVTQNRVRDCYSISLAHPSVHVFRWEIVNHWKQIRNEWVCRNQSRTFAQHLPTYIFTHLAIVDNITNI